MERATLTLHRLTSMGPYDEASEWDPPVNDPRVVSDLVVNDLDRLPWFYKSYPQSLPRVRLPLELPTTAAAAVDVLAGTATVARADLSLAQLSRVLHLSAGVVRITQRPYGTYLFRAAGSAGGRFPLEVYVAAPEGGLLPAGVYWYHPQDHSLVLVGPPPHGDSAVLVVTGVPWRTGWRYRERGYRHVYWDAGTMLSQLLAATDSAGLPARLHTRFSDQEVAALVGADGVHEWPVAVVSLGQGAPALSPAAPVLLRRSEHRRQEVQCSACSPMWSWLTPSPAPRQRSLKVDCTTDSERRSVSGHELCSASNGLAYQPQACDRSRSDGNQGPHRRRLRQVPDPDGQAARSDAARLRAIH